MMGWMITRTVGLGVSLLWLLSANVALAAPGVTAGDEHVVAVATDGSLAGWGRNDSGQLGDGTLVTPATAVAPVVPGGATAVAAGVDFTLALAKDGTVWAWGFNDSGQLGDGTTADSPTPVQVQGLAGIVAIAAGDHHGVALAQNGMVWTWGNNSAGQMADGTIANRTTPVSVAGLGPVAAIEAGGYFTLALLGDGSLWGWGQNNFGQLGDGTTDERHAPVAILPGSVAAIAAGYRHALALRADGTIDAWGFNDSGQLGDGLAINAAAYATLPQQVVGLNGATQIAAGAYHSLAVLGDGTVRAWGWNGNGQLGDGTTSDSSVPVTVSGAAAPLLLSGGLYSSVLLDTAGRLQAWGGNDYGQLGDGTTVEKHLPILVDLPGSLFNGPYQVTPQVVGSGGVIAPATAQTVSQGSTTSFELTPSPLYAIATASGCGGTLGGTTFTTAAILADCAVTVSFTPIDSDGDGVVDLNDNCPALVNADQTNTDLDGLGDACDPDDDNDTVADGQDAFPHDVTEWLDSDLDGTGNNADPDDDGDGWSDGDESTCGSDPLLLASLPPDLDNDHLCDVVDPDIDGDGFANAGDAFPLDGGEWLDSDLDNLGDNADLDDDNDGLADLAEIAAGTDPLNPDVTPPILTVLAPTDATATNQVTLNVSGQAGDETVLAAVLVNGVAVTVAGDGSFSTALTLGEGNNTITVTAVDSAGNRTVATRGVTLDSVLPTITVTTPADNSQSAVATIPLAGSLSEAATLDVRLNGGSWQAVVQAGLDYVDSLLLVEGSNTIELRAVDTLLNVATLTRTVLVDSNAPSLGITAPNADSTVHYPQVTVQGTVSDALTAVTLTVTVNGTPVPATVNGSDFSVALTLATAGTYLINVTATDELGNSAAATRNIVYAPYPSGDADNDGTLTAADALWALQQAVGLRALQPGDLGRSDVAPLVGGKPQSDGKISAIDALAILRKVVGLENW